MSHDLDSQADEHVVLDALPESVQETIDERRRWLGELANNDAFEFLISETSAWTPGQTVRVAFLGGSSALHRDIANVAKQIGDACNIVLDFGLDPDTGRYRAWSTNDASYEAEIRVSFDQSGYFSLVGQDSVDARIGRPGDPVGGRPGQRTLNLAGFDSRLPPTWRGTVLHEFLHALSFHHEHQNLDGPCQGEFRWEDDAGYQPTRTADGAFVPDPGGRRPGIYTYLSGYPNYWKRPKVDHNLRPGGGPVINGTFDRSSVMLYRFPPLFYRRTPNECAPDGDGQSLSAGDVDGLNRLYPRGPRGDHRARVERFLRQVDDEIAADGSLESSAPELRTGLRASAREALTRRLNGL
jgi:hypothetical protein